MDIVSREKRSWIMGRVPHRDTKPERIVRSAIHRMGFRFKLSVKGLPGSPDIVLPRHNKIILIHGCFWHQHPGCKAARRPKSNVDYWNQKFDGNSIRDKRDLIRLNELGWSVLVLWSCEVAEPSSLGKRISCVLSTNEIYSFNEEQC